MGFGEGLGAVIGSSMASDHLDDANRGVDSIGGNFSGAVAPFQQFGASFLPKATAAADKVSSVAGTSQSYEDFMKNYSTSEGAKYQIGVADAQQNNSAAARGQLLSGENLRSLDTINQGIASTDANKAYGSYLQGNQQQFGQLETTFGNMLGAVGVGTTATGQQGALDASQMGATASIAKSQAENDRAKGSGLGSMFSGIGSLAAMF